MEYQDDARANQTEGLVALASQIRGFSQCARLAEPFSVCFGAEDPPSNITAALTGILGSMVLTSLHLVDWNGITSPEQIQAAAPLG